uniref:F-box domain-containing protein n=1 Tax=Chenopodium quinoa TaxID=63459 RepID=A0A803M8Q3_CHEQI
MDSLEDVHPVLSLEDVMSVTVFSRLSPEDRFLAANVCRGWRGMIRFGLRETHPVLNMEEIMVLCVFSKLNWKESLRASVVCQNWRRMIVECAFIPFHHYNRTHSYETWVMDDIGDNDGKDLWAYTSMDMEISPCIILHHGGKWINEEQNLTYAGGQVKVFNDLGGDFDGTFIKSLINSLGYSNVIKLHYCDPLKNVVNGVRFLSYDDCTFTKFKSLLFEYKIIDVFTEHDEYVRGFNIGSGRGPICRNKETVVDEDVMDLGDQGEGVKDARERIRDDAKNEFQFSQELESLDRLAVRSDQLHLDLSSDDGEESNSDLDSPSQSDDDADCGFLVPKPKKCKGKDCKWYLWASLEGGNGTLTVKTLVPHHNCGRLAKVGKIRSAWIAKKYHSKFNVNPYLKCQEIVDIVWSEWGIKITLWMALKARRQAQKLILGEYKEQYSLLHRGVGVYTYPNGYKRQAMPMNTSQDSQSHSNIGSSNTTDQLHLLVLTMETSSLPIPVFIHLVFSNA